MEAGNKFRQSLLIVVQERATVNIQASTPQWTAHAQDHKRVYMFSEDWWLRNHCQTWSRPCEWYGEVTLYKRIIFWTCIILDFHSNSWKAFFSLFQTLHMKWENLLIYYIALFEIRLKIDFAVRLKINYVVFSYNKNCQNSVTYTCSWNSIIKCL